MPGRMSLTSTHFPPLRVMLRASVPTNALSPPRLGGSAKEQVQGGGR